MSNYGNISDSVFRLKLTNQPGQTFLTNTNLRTSKPVYTKKCIELNVPNLKEHELSVMDNLSNAVPLIEKKNPTGERRVLIGHIEKNGSSESVFSGEKKLTKKERLLQRLQWDLAKAGDVEEKSVEAPVKKESFKQDKAVRRDFIREEIEGLNFEKKRIMVSGSAKEDGKRFENIGSLYGYYNEELGENRIFSREEIDCFSTQ